MRLIDADKFKQEIVAVTIKNNLAVEKSNAMCALIDKQPTAYDVDKVTEQLIHLNLDGINMIEDGKHYLVRKDETIEIVKAGGLVKYE